MSDLNPTPVPGYSALLLAGGRSTRMGEDKAFLPWQGKPLWQGQIQKLRMLKPARLIIACREGQGLHQSAEPEVEWLFDPPNQDCGPIAPITQALELVQTPLLVLAVDMPQMTVSFLQEAVENRSEGGLFFVLPDGFEPLTGIYTPAMLPILHQALENQQFSLRRCLQQVQAEGLANFHPLGETETLLFTNTNTPEDWALVKP